MMRELGPMRPYTACLFAPVAAVCFSVGAMLLTSSIKEQPTVSFAFSMPGCTLGSPWYQPVVATIDVDFDGKLLLNDAMVPNIDAIRRSLEQAKNDKDRPLEVHIRPNALAPIHAVSKTISALGNGPWTIGVIAHYDRQ